MKVWLILAGLVALALAKNNFDAVPSSVPYIVQYIQHNEYEVETYTVTTQDGYILDLFRIPGKSGSSSQRYPVLLMHGFLSSAEDFVFNDMAFVLADKGFDVYLGNSRGSRYGQRHTTLNPHRDAAFWKFCFDQIGTKDLPVIIDKVLAVSRSDKLSYIGHMLGTTSFYVLGAERPEYLDKVDRMIALGPIAYMKHSTNVLLKAINEHISKGWLMKHIGQYTLKFSSELLAQAERVCDNPLPQVCHNPFFLFNGYNSAQFNQSIIHKVNGRVPFGGSVREVLHLAQLVKTGRFLKYTENFDYYSTTEYDLTKVTTPVAVFYTPQDSLSHVDDVQKLIEQLPSVYNTKINYHYENNLDFVYGKRSELFFNDVVQCLKQQIPKMDFI